MLDKTSQLEKELSALQSELDRIIFLLKIADPSGEAAKKRDSRVQGQKPDNYKAEAPAVAATKKHSTVEPKKSNEAGKPVDASKKKDRTQDSVVSAIESDNKPEADKIVGDKPEVKPAVYTVVKPQWLGAVNDTEVEETKQEVLNMDEADQFVDYKDRQKVLLKVDGARDKVDSGIESAAPGLIIRKQKETEGPGTNDNKATEQSTASTLEAKLTAEDAVALLLKHKRGYQAEDEGGGNESLETGQIQHNKDNKKPKRVLGPEKPSFLNGNSDYESWVPPEGISFLSV